MIGKTACTFIIVISLYFIVKAEDNVQHQGEFNIFVYPNWKL